MAAKRLETVAAALARTPASFAVFDVLWLDEDVTRLPYRDRRLLLEALDLAGAAWCTVSTFPGAGAELFAACTEFGLTQNGVATTRVPLRHR